MTSEVEIPKPTRREMLYYLGGASILLLAGEVGFGFSKFINAPVAKYGRGTGLFQIKEADIPQAQATPIYIRDAYCWLVNVDGGLVALVAQCVHDPAYVKWVPTNSRYECGWCGSKFHKDGKYIEGPAKRSLDHFIVRIIKGSASTMTSDNADPLSLEGAQSIMLDTSQIIPGKPRA